MLQKKPSRPTLTSFDPDVIPYQKEVINLIRRDFDYSIGTPEILLSGSFGSAKSVLAAHIAVTHCIMHPGARVCLGRRALPDLKRTIYKEILSHIDEDLKEGVHYVRNDTIAAIHFNNGSEIVSTSWADRKYKKVRSMNLSAVIIEELVENDDEDKDAFIELKARVRRIPSVKENFVLCLSNPDSPAHWAYDYYIAGEHDCRFVYYSNTFDNPFLDPIYIEQLKRDLDPKRAQRYIWGQWIEIAEDVVYYAYDRKTDNYVNDQYTIDESLPITATWDFNIGVGKPLSVALLQFDRRGHMHIFGEVIVEGMRTEDSCEELAGRGFLDYNTKYIINGDATGRARSTRNIKSDWEIIKDYFSNYVTKDGRQMNFEVDVPLSNGAVRARHNAMNAYFLNTLGERRIHVYKTAPTVDKAFRLTALKKGGEYIEDDSKPYQHVGCACGYALLAYQREVKGHEQRTIQL